MIYDLETVVCDGKSMESTLLPLMDAIAAVGMRVMVSVKDWMQQSRDHRTGGPGSQTYERLKNTTDLLGNHRALLGCETAILSRFVRRHLVNQVSLQGTSATTAAPAAASRVTKR